MKGCRGSTAEMGSTAARLQLSPFLLPFPLLGSMHRWQPMPQPETTQLLLQAHNQFKLLFKLYFMTKCGCVSFFNGNFHRIIPGFLTRLYKMDKLIPIKTIWFFLQGITGSPLHSLCTFRSSKKRKMKNKWHYQPFQGQNLKS